MAKIKTANVLNLLVLLPSLLATAVQTFKIGKAVIKGKEPPAA